MACQGMGGRDEDDEGYQIGRRKIQKEKWIVPMEICSMFLNAMCAKETVEIEDWGSGERNLDWNA